MAVAAKRQSKALWRNEARKSGIKFVEPPLATYCFTTMK